MKIAYSIGLIFLLLITNALAIELQSNYYNSGDTFIASSSELISTSKAKIKDNNNQEVHLGLLNYNIANQSFLYFDIPLWMSGNYSLQYEDKNLPFTIGQGDAVTIRPIVIYLEKGISNARIDLTNRLDYAVTIEAKSANQDIIFSRTTITVPAASTRNLYLSFDADKIKDSSIELNYDSGKRAYFMPLMVAKEEQKPESVSLVTEPSEEVKPEQEGFALRIDENLTSIKHKVPRTKMINGSLNFMSNKNLNDLQFHLTPEIAEIITLNTTGYDLMEANKEYELYLWINRYRNFPEGEYNGMLSLDSKDGQTVNVSVAITLTSPILKEEMVTSKLNITRPSFNATEVKEPITFVNYTEEAQKEKEQDQKNLRLGLLLSGILLLIAAVVVYLFRPKPKELKFQDYVSQFKKGAKKK